jgi:hypothetical protein
LNLNCASIIGRSFTNFVFFMLIVILLIIMVHTNVYLFIILLSYKYIIFFSTPYLQCVTSYWKCINNILSHNVVLSTPHQVVNLLGIYDQSVVSHFFFFLICAETSGPIYIV